MGKMFGPSNELKLANPHAVVHSPAAVSFLCDFPFYFFPCGVSSFVRYTWAAAAHRYFTCPL
jgi:hypothetical protein